MILAMETRFVTRPDPEGFTVYDLQTGQAAIIAMARQRGLSQADAAHIAELLNQRAAGGGEELRP